MDLDEFNFAALGGTGVHAIRLGYLSIAMGRPNLTVVDQVSGVARGMFLREEDYDFLSGLDPSVPSQSFTPEQEGLLLTLERDSAFAFYRTGDPLETLDLIPVKRADIAVVGETEDGFLMRVGPQLPFEVTALGSRLFEYLVTGTKLGDVVIAARDEMLSDPEEREILAEIEQEESRPLQDILTDELFILIRQLVQAGAITIEPNK